jgi:FtsP/CotA-like multicopper oxidase with cupredoxin domain
MRYKLFSNMSLFFLLSAINNLQANQQILQSALDPMLIPKFVEPVPLFNKSRVKGNKKLKIFVEEFQQQILPTSFYATLPDEVTYLDPSTGKEVVTINPQLGTYVWGYKIERGKKKYGPQYPGFTIVAEQNVATKVKYINNLLPFKDKDNRKLPGPLLQKFITVDRSVGWGLMNKPATLPFIDPATNLPLGNPAFYSGAQPVVTHLHGAAVPSAFDGGPDSWFTPHQKITGPGFVTTKYVYPNQQNATTLWYHDHMMGGTRLSIYTGLSGFYFLRSAQEEAANFPRGDYEVELLIQDRQFDTNGQLFWPDGLAPSEGLNGAPSNPGLHPYAIPEFFGDVMVVNGKSWPYLEVEPRRYRFRFLNGTNARFLALQLGDAGGNEIVTSNSAPDIWQIGSDGGLLPNPVNINSFTPFSWIPQAEYAEPPFSAPWGKQVFDSPRLFVGPAERMDVIIDFTDFKGQTFTLINDAPFPFPGGDDPEGSQEFIMQFRVLGKATSKDKSFDPAEDSLTNNFVALTDGDGHLAPGVTINLTRRLVLIEQEDPNSGGPVWALQNNVNYNGINPYTNEPIPGSIPVEDGMLNVTELPRNGSTELWEIINLTPDAHPIHVHLIQFQLLNRQVINIGDVTPPFVNGGYRQNTYEQAWIDQGFPDGTLYGAGSPFLYTTPIAGALGGNPAVPLADLAAVYSPDPNEFAWKDTIKVFPGTITRVVMRFAPQNIPVGGVTPGQNKFSFDPTAGLDVKHDSFGYPGGPGYVWHCHIIDHEDNSMMRPYLVKKVPQS